MSESILLAEAQAAGGREPVGPETGLAELDRASESRQWARTETPVAADFNAVVETKSDSSWPVVFLMDRAAPAKSSVAAAEPPLALVDTPASDAPPTPYFLGQAGSSNAASAAEPPPAPFFAEPVLDKPSILDREAEPPPVAVFRSSDAKASTESSQADAADSPERNEGAGELSPPTPFFFDHNPAPTPIPVLRQVHQDEPIESAAPLAAEPVAPPPIPVLFDDDPAPTLIPLSRLVGQDEPIESAATEAPTLVGPPPIPVLFDHDPAPTPIPVLRQVHQDEPIESAATEDPTLVAPPPIPVFFDHDPAPTPIPVLRQVHQDEPRETPEAKVQEPIAAELDPPLPAPLFLDADRDDAPPPVFLWEQPSDTSEASALSAFEPSPAARPADTLQPNIPTGGLGTTEPAHDAAPPVPFFLEPDEPEPAPVALEIESAPPLPPSALKPAAKAEPPPPTPFFFWREPQSPAPVASAPAQSEPPIAPPEPFFLGGAPADEEEAAAPPPIPFFLPESHETGTWQEAPPVRPFIAPNNAAAPGEPLPWPAIPPEPEPTANLGHRAQPIEIGAAPRGEFDLAREARTHLEQVMSSLEQTVATSSPAGALPSPQPVRSADTGRFVVFFLGGGRWAAPLEDVLEMGTVPKITPLPHVPAFVRGVTNLRGEVLAVIDLRSVLGFDSPSDPSRERLLVMKAPGREAAGGFIVDGVRGLARVAPEEIAAPALPASEQAGRFLRGVTGQDGAVLNVLDTKMLFDSPEMLRLAAS